MASPLDCWLCERYRKSRAGASASKAAQISAGENGCGLAASPPVRIQNAPRPKLSLCAVSAVNCARIRSLAMCSLTLAAPLALAQPASGPILPPGELHGRKFPVHSGHRRALSFARLVRLRPKHIFRPGPGTVRLRARLSHL